MSRAVAEPIRVAARVTGVVEGVGFRPFVHAAATELRLAGEVGNDDSGVFLAVEGPPAQVAELLRRVAEEAPAPAVVEAVRTEKVPPLGQTEFRIVASRHDPSAAATPIPPDTAICPDCLAELRDPADRRYRYPFTACAHCGPRYTIVTGLPYDRPQTTMVAFPLCSACAAEYHDPADRRFHAQPTCCPECGPQLTFETADGPGAAVGGEEALAAAVALLAAGRIVAVKGVGGYHLACDPRVPGTVDRLRQRKHRSAKPLAVMVRDLSVAGRFARIDALAEEALTSPAAPIVLVDVRDDPRARALVESVAPGLAEIGLLLPYSPLHHVLMERFDLLVMTSGNLADEPLAIDTDEARSRLAGIADGWLHHDRPIAVACDDSVVRAVDTGAGDRMVRPVRRSRGYAPVPLRLPTPAPPLLAVGGELKATVCLAAERRAWLSQHIGDVAGLETLAQLSRTVDTLGALTRITPEVVVADAHPGYLSRRWASDRAARTGAELRLVQHHHAHLASLIAESDGVTGPVLGVVFDGTGYGTDGTIWGGELLLADAADLTAVARVGHLAPIALPGGDAAIRRPARTALAHLTAAGIGWDDRLPPVAAAADDERRIVGRMLQTGTGCTPTSSVGRLFDAIASLVGLRHDVGYEAQAAMELEALATATGALPTGSDADQWRIAVARGTTGITLDPAPFLRAAVAAVLAGQPAGRIGWAFHAALADAVTAAAESVRADTAVAQVGLSGGVFGNALLSRMCAERLSAAGFTVLQHRRVPPNDGGLALGQAAVVAAGGGI